VRPHLEYPEAQQIILAPEIDVCPICKQKLKAILSRYSRKHGHENRQLVDIQKELNECGVAVNERNVGKLYRAARRQSRQCGWAAVLSYGGRRFRKKGQAWIRPLVLMPVGMKVY
jgi:hypothetical protein